MYTRVITSQYQAGKMEEALHIYRESILPALKQQQGFNGAIALGDSQTGKALSMTLWETAADLQAGAASGHLQAQLAKVVPFFARVPGIETAEARIWEREQGTPVQYARVLTFQLQPHTTDEFVQLVRTSVLPVARQQAGARGVLVFTNASQNYALTVTLWERQADLEASGYVQEQLAKGASFLVTAPKREVYKIMLLE